MSDDASKPCIDLGLPPIPTVPDLLLGSPTLLLPLPDVDLLCCKFKIAIPALDEAIAATNLAMAGAIATLGAPFLVAILAINEQIATAQAEVNKLRLRLPTCPCDGTTITP